MDKTVDSEFCLHLGKFYMFVYMSCNIIHLLHFLLQIKISVQVVLSVKESALTDVSSDQLLQGYSYMKAGPEECLHNWSGQT